MREALKEFQGDINRRARGGGSAETVTVARGLAARVGGAGGDRGHADRVWWYVPSVSQMQALRTERAQLQASIEELNNQGARMQTHVRGRG